MRARPRRGIGAAVLGGLLAIGGGLASAQGGSSVDGGDEALIAEALAAPLPAEPGPDDGGEAFQREVFSDGVVTFEEYRRAVASMIACMERAGFAVEGPFGYPDDARAPIVIAPGEDPSHRLTYAVVATGDDSLRTGVMEGCEMRWLYRVEYVWLAKHAPSEADIEAWLQRAADCARTYGLPVSSPPTADEIVRAVQQGCRPWEASSPATG